MTSWPGNFRCVGFISPTTEVQPWGQRLCHGKAAARSASSARHFGQYHGAGTFTGFGLRFRHMAHRYRLPFTAVLGLNLLPVRGMFFGMGASWLREVYAGTLRERFRSVRSDMPARKTDSPIATILIMPPRGPGRTTRGLRESGANRAFG